MTKNIMILFTGLTIGLFCKGLLTSKTDYRKTKELKEIVEANALKEGNQTALNQASQLGFEETEKLINKLYDSIQKEHQNDLNDHLNSITGKADEFDAQHSALLKMRFKKIPLIQKKFDEYKNLCAELSASINEGGSMYGMVYTSEISYLNEQHIEFLENYLEFGL
jgi:hypothetical protein